MNNKKRLLISLCCALVASSATVGFTSCESLFQPIDNSSSASSSSSVLEERFEGTGDYYTQSSDGVEYNLTLSDGNVTMTLGGAALTGTYSYANKTLTMTFGDGSTATATLANEVLTVQYNGGTYRFIKKVNYVVSYSVDGTVAMMVPVLNGKKATKPADPVKAGYAFVGWYVDAAFTKAYAFDANLVTEDVTLYARFVEVSAGQQEFVATFVVDGVETATANTVSGAIYDFPAAPTKEGATFAGWWMSDYDDAEKLTCKYEEQKVGENVTLYAVWESAGALVSVSGNGVKMTAKGVNNSYRVKISNAAGEVLNGAQGGNGETTTANEYAFDFSAQPAGDYVVEVIFNGETTTAYYCNKALDKVCNFSIEGDTVFTFNTVANAEKYLLTVKCGNGAHNHTDLDLGTANYYNFESCEMKKGGIEFIVKAVANGYVTSTSETYSIERNLDAVTGLTYDDANDQFVWDVVPNAKSYVVEVNGQTFAPSVNTYFSVKDYNAGELTIKVYPVAKGYNSSDAVTMTYNKVRLQTPVNISVSGTTVTWDTVTGAKSYVVKIGDKTFPVATNTITLTSEHYTAGQDTCAISVSAVGETEATSSHYSETVTVRFASMANTLAYANGTVAWEYVVNAARYAVKVNGGEETIVAANANRAPVVLTKAGINLIEVCYYDKDGNASNWVQTTVFAYAIEFDVQGGYAINTQYKAKGDSYELPNASAIGYDFGGWYNIPGGADDNGEKYASNGVFEGDSDMVVYAYWTPKAYEVTFVVDDGSVTGTIQEEKVTVYYGKKYTLPKAVADDPTYMFGGWYANYGGVGVQYVDQNGESLTTWTFTEDQTFYVGWLKVMEMTEVAGGYSVAQGVDIKKVTEIVIPAAYNGMPVVEIAASAFKNCDKLEKISIPDTIQLITFTVDGPYSTGSAFQGCNNLKTLEMYCPDEANHGIGEHVQKYFVVDGMLIENDEFSGMELQFIPKKHESALTGVLTIPSSVEVLPINVFSGAAYTKIIVPASVTRIHAYAFAEGSSDKLTEVEFLAAEDGVEKPLVIEANAFDKRGSLKEVTLPARVQEFDPVSVFSECNKLSKITITGESADQVYSTKAGILCDKSGATMLYCPPAYAGVDGVFEIPAGVTEIAEGAFKGCKNITTLKISGQVTKIGKNAFADCTGLTKIEFLDTEFAADLTIGEKAFYGCNGLKDLTLPRNLVGLGKYAFGATTRLKTVVVDTDGANLNFANGAFASESGANYVTNLTLGEKVSEIAINGVFGGSIVNVYVDENSPYYSSIDGVLFNKAETEIVCFPAGKVIPAEGYTLPESVEVIGAGVFKGKHNLTKITIGKNVKRIDEEAFANAIYLTEVVFDAPAEGVTLTIGEKAFANCSGLTENTFALPAHTRVIGDNAFEKANGFTTFVIPEGVTTMGDFVFNNAKNLKSVSIPSTVTSMGGYEDGALSSMQVFASCGALENITVADANTAFMSINGILYVETEGNATELLLAPVYNKGKTVEEADGSISYVAEVPATVTKVWAKAFNLNENLTKILFADSVVDGGTLTVGNQAFENAYAVKEVKLPEGLAEIATSMFQGCSRLETINVPASVTKIGVQAFYGCRKLREVNFAQTRTENLTFTDAASGTGAFAGCAALEELILPEKTTTIGNYTFQGLKKLSDVTLPSTLTKIGNYAFYNTGVTSITIPATVTTLGTNAFQYCEDLATLVVNASTLTTIGNYAFANCTSLESVELTNAKKLTTIGNYAFYEAPMTGIALPTSLTTINTYAFAKTGLTSIVIPKAVKSMGTYVFYKCADLVTATFEAYTTTGYATSLSLGANMFDSCTSLTALAIPKNVATIPSNFVYYCRALKSITFAANGKLATISQGAFKGCGIEEIAFPESTSVSKLTLNKEIFYNCQYLTKVTLSTDVQSVTNVFDGCDTINEIVVTAGSKYFSSAKDSDFLLSADGKTIAAAIGKVKPADGILTLPETVEAIGASAFKGQNYIKKVVFPSKLQTIGQYAFQDCLALEEVEFSKDPETGDDCLLNKIDKYAFDGCTALKKVHLPHVVTEIADYAFQDCSALNDVVLNANLAKVGNYVFSKCTSLVSIRIPASLTTIGTYMFSGCTALTSVTLDDEMTTLGNYMFKDCESLTSITLPTELEKLGTYTFQNTSITSIIIPEGVTMLGTSETSATTAAAVFSGCAELQSVTFLGEIKAIGQESFKDCVKLTTINFPEALKSVVTIGEGETAVTKAATLPNTVTMIGKGAFQGTGLTSVIMPDSVKTLGASVFQGCESVTSVYVPAVTAMGASLFNACINLTEVNLATGITYSSDMFSDCTSLVSVHIPAPAEGKAVGGSMFSDCTALTTVTFDDSITTFGAFMFSGCTSLTGVDAEGKETLKLPASLTQIGQDSFMESGITKITIPEGVTRLSSLTAAITTSNWKTAGNGPFKNCANLESVTILGDVELIGGYTFSGCTKLKTLTLPESVKYISRYAFQDSGIETINLGKVEYIGEKAFSGSMIKEADLSSVAKFEATGSFMNCTELENITLGNNLTKFYSSTFEGCTKLGTDKEIILPSSLKDVSSNAFKNTGISKITIPESVTTISSGAFAGTKLTSFHIPASITGITGFTAGVLADCENLTTITSASTTYVVVDGLLYNSNGYLLCAPMGKTYTDGVLTLPEGKNISNSLALSGLSEKITKVVLNTPGTATNNKAIGTSVFKNFVNLTEIVIGEGYELIDDYAFQGCTSLSKVTLPSTLKTIDAYAFDGCSALTEISLPETLTTLGNYALSKTGLTSIELPGSLAGKMGTYVFYECKDLKSVVVGEGITTLGNYLFYGCESLHAVVFPEESLATIGQRTFAHTGMEEIIVPESVTKVDSYAFAYGANLASVEFKGVPTTIGTNLFYESYALKDVILASGWTTFSNYMFSKSGLESFEIPQTVNTIGTYAFQNCTALTEVILPVGLSTIGVNMFDGCTALTSIAIPESVLSIGNYAFKNTGIVTAEIPNTVLSMGEGLFQNSANLTSVKLPEGFDTIPYRIFEGCTSMTEYTIPATIKEIGQYAFAGTGLVSIDIPNTVKSIGDYAFKGCESLNSVKLPDNLTVIEQYLFQNCTSLKTLDIPATVYTIETGAFDGAGLTALTIPELVTEIPSYMVRNCASLATLILPKNLVMIRSNAFEGATSISSIVIPATVNSMSSNMFKGWTAEQTIYFEGSEADVAGTTTYDVLGNCEAEVVYDYKA